MCKQPRKTNKKFAISLYLCYLCHMKRLRLLILYLCLASAQVTFSQRACLQKLSSQLRHYALENQTSSMARQKLATRTTTTFIKIEGDGERILQEKGCQVLAKWGNIYIASVPLSQITPLSWLPEVKRMEANSYKKCLMDSAIYQVNAIPVYEGLSLPAAYTGKGVVMGIMDIGFDYTNPNFYNYQMDQYRIKAVWDQLSKDTIGCPLPVGREYTNQEELLAQGCSTDGELQYHGSHTLGIAAGSGSEGIPSNVPGKYHGIAYDSDICLVANATTENMSLIDPSQQDKFTYAMDALGFKYIFDYADKVGKPCVISFSEGSDQDFHGYDILYNEVLDSLTSKPGHILVTSAGNNGNEWNYLHKPIGKESAGCFVKNRSDYIQHTVKSRETFSLKTNIYENQGTSPTSILVTSAQVTEAHDSTWTKEISIGDDTYTLTIAAYPSCYNPQDICYDWMIKSVNRHIGETTLISYQVVGKDADVEMYRTTGEMYANDCDPTLADGDNTHSINSPACAESMITVGATVNRTSFTNVDGQVLNVINTPQGSQCDYSSIGPTFDGRIKPDVMAPGANVIASYNHFNGEKYKNSWDVEHFQYQGHTYAWNNMTGTSMSSPIVGGAIALWLQANPNLTRDDVKRIISKTSRPLDAQLQISNNQWGYGEIDVYRGLLSVLQLDGIKEISTHQPRQARMSIHNGELSIIFDENATQDFSIHIFTIGGIKVMSRRLKQGSDRYAIDVKQLPRGIYAIQLTGSKEITGSMLLEKHTPHN